MRYFGIRELVPCVDGHCRDGRCGYDESTIVRVPGEVTENAIALVENVLDPARKALGKAIRVNSGYRCPLKNKAVGGVAGSQHLKGEAADIAPAGFKVDLRSSSFAPRKSSSELDFSLGLASVQDSGFKEELKRLARIIVAIGRYDQVIMYPTFVHVSWKRAGGNRQQVLKKVGNGYVPVKSEELIVKK